MTRRLTNSTTGGRVFVDVKDGKILCTGCGHLMDEGWTETRCSQICSTEAIKLILAEDAEMAKRVAAEGLEVLKAELSAKPRVYYPPRA